MAILKKINKACQASQRVTNKVNLIAASKSQSIAAVQAAIDAGLLNFGESYIQEAIPKILSLKTQLNSNKQILWHFIGHIQSNKTKLIAQHFDWVQSIDRLKIAILLNEQRPAKLKPLKVCIQINVAGEPQRSGVILKDVLPLAEQISTMRQLKLKGVMAITSNSKNSTLLKQQFLLVKQLYDQLKNQHQFIDTLSMGMSADMNIAIACGSTMVRIGQGIFGSRVNH